MYYLLGNHILEAIKLFRRGVEVFQSDAMPLWDIITQFITSTNDYNEVWIPMMDNKLSNFKWIVKYIH